MNKLSRPLERWANCSPAEMAKMSPAAIQFAFEDAKHDIALLARGWLPIDTAPKDGTEVLVWSSAYHKPCVAKWHRRWQCWMLDEEYSLEGVDTPTHWQPLPEPPQ